jgi:hypothetical protein
MTSAMAPQKWCGQTQPHNPHVWVETTRSIGIYMSCAGYALDGGTDE